jgi:hypothetical protein
MELRCDTAPFTSDPPRDLLSEITRLLEELSKAANQKELFVPRNSAEYSPRLIHDSDGNLVGEIWFES